MIDIDKLFEEAKASVQETDEERVSDHILVKTVPMSKQEIKYHDEYLSITKGIAKEIAKLGKIRAKLWKSIETSHGFKNENLHINDKTNEVELYKSKEEVGMKGRPVKSPIQMM